MPLLKWVNDADARRAASQVPFHLLERKAVYGDPDQAENNLIVHGDNLVALKALLPFYKGKVKCIYIDPPYNSGNAFEYYDDNLEHSQWLSLMYSRLVLLRDYLQESGCIWIQIDDDEQAYLKTLCDEVFGRNNFINMISVNMKNISGASGGGEDKKLKKNCEYILVYAKSYSTFKGFNPVFEYKVLDQYIKQYKDEGRSWKYVTVFNGYSEKTYLGSCLDGSGNEIKVYKLSGVQTQSVNQAMKNEGLENDQSSFYKRYGVKIFRTTNSQSSIRQRVIEFKKLNNIKDEWLAIEYIPKSGKNKGQMYEQLYKDEVLVVWLKDTLTEINGQVYKKEAIGTYWDMNPNMKNLTKEGGVLFPNGKKPEALIQRILELSTQPGDLVMDSFLGSGTVAAVSQKMNRNYIGIEMGPHALTHCIPRMQKVIDGEQGGISKSANWHGGGGFSFYELSAQVFDKYGAINPQVPFEILAAYIWQSETGCVGSLEKKPFLGVRGGVGIYLLYNGVLGYRRPESGNVLTPELLNDLLAQYPHDGSKVIYAEAMIGIDELELRERMITFKQIPYDIRD